MCPHLKKLQKYYMMKIMNRNKELIERTNRNFQFILQAGNECVETWRNNNNIYISKYEILLLINKIAKTKDAYYNFFTVVKLILQNNRGYLTMAGCKDLIIEMAQKDESLDLFYFIANNPYYHYLLHGAARVIVDHYIEYETLPLKSMKTIIKLYKKKSTYKTEQIVCYNAKRKYLRTKKIRDFFTKPRGKKC